MRIFVAIVGCAIIIVLTMSILEQLEDLDWMGMYYQLGTFFEGEQK